MTYGKREVLETPQHYQDYGCIVQNEAISIKKHLRKFLSPIIDTFDIQLSLKEGEKSERLSRGINEIGLIKPDFGKPFYHLFYEDIQIILNVKKEVKIDGNEFMERYITGLIMDYFIQHPSDFSNWELNQRNRKASGHANMPARHINFPKIQLHLE